MSIQALRGMPDVLPDACNLRAQLLRAASEIIESYGFREISLPLLEKTELFARSIGEVTDIVEKEMYTFDDRNGESMTLRPEATAGVVRAVVQHSLAHSGAQKLWLAGPMFRYERPQKGRYRQFNQINVEAFGLVGPDIDVELIAIGARLWKRLGVADALTLELNSLGDGAGRQAHRAALVAYLREHAELLDADAARRLETNPLRVLDSKTPDMQAMLAAAPQLPDFWDAESREHFETLTARLDDLGIAWTLNPRLVRGLDYYSRTVFEWTTTALGAQNAVCSGGRYDGLVEQIGGKPTPAVGFAIGVERLVALMEAAGAAPEPVADLYLAALGAKAEAHAAVLAEQLRDALPGVRLLVNAGGGSFKAQLKRADRCGAQFALVLGDAEVESETVQVKPLRVRDDQQAVAQSALADFIRKQRSATPAAA